MAQTFAGWRCWLCGATHAENGTRLTHCGLTTFNHLRAHERAGLLRRSTWAERDAGEGAFQLTEAGRAYLKARQGGQDAAAEAR